MQPRTVEVIASLAGGVLVQGDPHVVLHGVTTDSRRVQAGDLFIPLRGPRFDGHQFVGAALAKGASAAMVGKGFLASLAAVRDSYPEAALIAVPDTLHGLHVLAAQTRQRLRNVEGRVAAVTGSVGKTTTKDMLAAMVGVRWKTTSTLGNLNNEIGLPLTLLQADDATEAIVLEMGMRGLGEIRELARIARPDVAVVTNVSEVHLGPLGTVERIAVAKRELVDELGPEGTAVLNGDDVRVREMARHARGRTVLFGFGPHNDVRGEDVVSLGMDGVRFTWVQDGERRSLHIPMAGRHNVYNALAAVGAAWILGLDGEEIREGLARFAAARSDMRLQFRPRRDGLLVIDDAYNAGPASMQAALDVLRDMPRGRRRVAVLGDMLELGSVASAAHAAVGRGARAAGVDVLIAVGQYADTVADAAREAGLPGADIFVCATADEAAERAEALVRADDIVLVKASRGIALETVVNRLLSGEPDFSSPTEEAPR